MISDLLHFSISEWLLIGLTTGSCLWLILYYTIVYARPLRKARKKTEITDGEPAAQPPVSVIVYSNGDAAQLHQNLPAILTQDYSDFEVIVVNDGSDADSEDVLKLFSHEHKHLYFTFVPNETQYLSHKKLALTMGIKAARHDILLFIEINSAPVSNQWITSMATAYTPETEIVLGFCSYPWSKGFKQKLIAYDNLMQGLQYLASALGNRPFSGNGNNLSYRKSLFFAQKGYSKSLYLHAGSDDLFINSVANRKNTRVVYSPESLTRYNQIDQWFDYKELKVARAATRPYFRGGRLNFFRLESFLFFLFLGSEIALTVVGILAQNPLLWILALLLFVLRFAVKASVFRRSALLLNQQPATGALFLLELARPFYHLTIRSYRLTNSKKDYTAKI